MFFLFSARTRFCFLLVSLQHGPNTVGRVCGDDDDDGGGIPTPCGWKPEQVTQRCNKIPEPRRQRSLCFLRFSTPLLPLRLLCFHSPPLSLDIRAGGGAQITVFTALARRALCTFLSLLVFRPTPPAPGLLTDGLFYHIKKQCQTVWFVRGSPHKGTLCICVCLCV